MLNRLKSLLEKQEEVTPDQRHERIQVATCVILLEMAHTDEEFHEMEEVLIRDILQRKFGLSAEAVEDLMEFAQEERQDTLDIFQFTRRINENFSIEEKTEILESLWRIVYADGVLDKYEDYLIRKLANLLRLSHRQMIEAKVKVLDETRGRD